MTKQELLIEKLKEYSKFLGEEIDKNAMFIHVHGIDASDEIVEKGVRLRAEIAILESEIAEEKHPEGSATLEIDDQTKTISGQSPKEPEDEFIKRTQPDVDQAIQHAIKKSRKLKAGRMANITKDRGEYIPNEGKYKYNPYPTIKLGSEQGHGKTAGEILKEYAELAHNIALHDYDNKIYVVELSDAAIAMEAYVSQKQINDLTDAEIIAEAKIYAIHHSEAPDKDCPTWIIADFEAGAKWARMKIAGVIQDLRDKIKNQK